MEQYNYIMTYRLSHSTQKLHVYVTFKSKRNILNFVIKKQKLTIGSLSVSFRLID